MNPCPTCNKPLPAFTQEKTPKTQTRAAKAIQTIVCDGCAAVLDARGAFPSPTKQSSPLPISHVPLRLCSKGHLDGRDYTVIGWVRYEGSDDYEDESWSWESWRLQTATGESHWLSFSSEEGFLLLTPLPVPKAWSPDDTHFPVPGGLADKTSRSTAQVSALAGVFDEIIRLGDSGEYVTATAAGESFCLEWVRGALELFQVHPVSLAALSKAFGLKRLRMRLLWSAFSAPQCLLLPNDTTGLLSLADEPDTSGALSVIKTSGSD